MAKTPTTDQGFGAHIGLEMTERGHERSVGRIAIEPMHLNPHGTVHGGVLYTMADQGMGAAVYSVLDEGESCATIEVKMAYIAAAREGDLVCETRLVSKGRRVAFLESDVTNNGRLVAKALGSFAIFPLKA